MDSNFMAPDGNDEVSLVITEQPQASISFRYLSEMKNPHGYLYGATYESSGKDNKNCPKTFPTVKLVLPNHFIDKTLKVIASLVQDKSDVAHPYELHGEFEKPVKDNVVRFDKLNILSRKKKDVQTWMASQNPGLNNKEIKTLLQNVNEDAVRIRFSAVDTVKNQEICSPVYSSVIKNKRNCLKINLLFLHKCTANGEKECVLLASNFQKSDQLKVYFIEKSKDGEELWKVSAVIEQIYLSNNAITLRVPAYKDQNITSDVEVCVQLVRHSLEADETKSELIPFVYTPVQPSKRENLKKSEKNRKRTFNEVDANIYPTPPMTPAPPRQDPLAMPGPSHKIPKNQAVDQIMGQEVDTEDQGQNSNQFIKNDQQAQAPRRVDFVETHNQINLNDILEIDYPTLSSILENLEKCIGDDNDVSEIPPEN